MVEIVFCRVTRRGRKKKAGMNKLLAGNTRNDGPSQSFIPPDTLKVTLDLSDSGPVFSALDDMMTKLSLDSASEKRKPESGDAKKALKNLLKSGIPGIEGMFGAPDPTPRFGKKGGKKGFHKMNDGSKKKFMNAIFGEEGTQIDSSTAAALLAATCSGGDPDVGNRLAELLVPEMDEKVDPSMMAALMSACSLISAGAGTEEVMAAMKLELSASGLSEEEILHKTQLLMKAFGKEEVGSTAEYRMLSKQKNKALVKQELPPKDFTAIVLAHKAIAACGSTPENCAKILMIYSTLAKKGANMEHVAASMKNLGAIEAEKKEDCKQKILEAWANPKFTKNDVMVPVRLHQALDNENEPAWAEVKNLKEIVGGVAPSSPEAIELNLARATKSGGLKKDDIGRALIALKAIRLLGVDEVQLAKTMFLEKTICENGVPGGEVGRVLNDGMMPAEAVATMAAEAGEKLLEDVNAADVDVSVKVYNNLKFKSNIPTEVIEYVDKSLIQVRCSLEDVADNMISSLSARGEKTSRIISQVTEMLKKTGATASVTATTLISPLMDLTGDSECQLIRTIARNLKDVDYENEEVKAAVLEMTLKILDNDIQMHSEAVAAVEATLKDIGMMPDEIREFILDNLPPPPTPPEEVERRNAIAAELERLAKEEEERERLKKLKDTDPEAYEKEMAKMKKGPLDALKSDSRRGSLNRSDSMTGPLVNRSRQGSVVLGGTERRGSYYSEDVTTRASVAVITDDPEHKKNLKAGLAGAFNEAQGILPPGTAVSTGADGSITVGGVPLPPGSKIKKLPDGSIQVLDASGEPMSLSSGPDGKGPVVGSKRAQAGSPGSKVEKLADGSVIETLPDGTTVTKGPDGSILPGPPVPKGAKVEKLPDGSGAVKADNSAGAALPPGMNITVGPGGKKSLNGIPIPPGAQLQTLSDGSVAIISPDGTRVVAPPGNMVNGFNGLANSLDTLMSDASPEEIQKKLLASGMSESEVKAMMGAIAASGGKSHISPETRALMEQIMKSSGTQEEISGRVLALLAGSSLSTTRGVDRKNTEIDLIDYEAGNIDGMKGKSDKFEMPSIPRLDIPNLTRESAGVGGVKMRDSGGQIKRGSVKRQSEIIRERHKSRQEEREEEKRRRQSYYRKVTGLRRAKVPLMVYSCGGFSRCFRVARFYDVDGPPVGIEYDRPATGEERRRLNPEL